MTTSTAARQTEPQARAPRPPRRGSRLAGRRGLALYAYTLLLPAVAILLVFTSYPLVKMFLFSVQDYTRANLFNRDKPVDFVGLDNYREVLTDPTFWAVMARSLALCVVLVTLTMTLGMLIALLMNRVRSGLRVLVSVGLLLAWAMPQLTSTVVWGWMFDSEYGVVNYLLMELGFDQYFQHSWLYSPLSFFLVLSLIITWQSVPFVAFTLYGALTQVPGEVLEAAEIDGANAQRRFWQVTVPFIKPVLAVVLILQVIWDMRVFTQVYALQGMGAQTEATNTIGVYIFRHGVAQGNFGTGSAIAVLLTVVMLILSFGYLRSMLKEAQP